MSKLGKILVVDDDRINLDIFKHLLETQYDLAVASSGEETLVKVPQFNPDLILLDIMMPGISGYEVCKTIKQNDKNFTKVILVSAKAMLDERLMGYEAGADDYIAKPFDHEEFLAKVKIFIKLKKAEDELRGLNTSLESAVQLRTQQLMEAEKEANTAKNDIDNIIKSMIDPLLVLSLDLKIQKVNPATLRLLQYPWDELNEKAITSLIIEQGIFSQSELEGLLSKGFTDNKPLTFIARDKTEIPTFISRSVLRDEDGKVSGIVCVAKDMTQQRKTENEKDVIQRQLMQASKLASIGELAAGIAHEINNPLTIIKGNVEIISDHFTETNNKEYLEFVEYQQQAIERIRNIVTGLKTYARLDTAELSTINIHDVLDDTVTIINQIYKNENINIIRNLNSSKPFTIGSSGRFQQVIMNLISNARDAMEGKGQGKVTITTENDEKTVIVKVSDSGCGIPNEQVEKIFDPFFTSKPVGKGTGLGLSIVLSIINEMKGKIRVESKINIGTTFIISLPLSKDEITTPKPSSGVGTGDPMKPGYLKLSGKVLIVDDEEAIVQIMSRYLKEIGFGVESALNGLEALEKLHKEEFTLLITDLKMPKMNGTALIKEIRRTVSSEKMKIIAMTGHLSDDSFERQVKNLSHDVEKLIKKPFSKREIYEDIKKIL